VPVPDTLEVLVVDTGVRRALRDGGFAARRAECQRALEGARHALGRELGALAELGAADLAPLEAALDPVALRRARHVTSENARVDRFVEALQGGDLELLGRLLYASHESLHDDYQVTCPESDFLVDATRGLPDVLGARITGAGWGGCTLHLVRSGGSDAVARAVATRFEGRFGRRPSYWTLRSGDGASLVEEGPA
jgi:galactokinase